MAKYRYELWIEEDTNDGDYINATSDLGIYDTDKKADMDCLKTLCLLCECFDVDYGNDVIDMETFKKGIEKANIDLLAVLKKEYNNSLNESRISNDSKLEEVLKDWVWKHRPKLDNCDNNHDFWYELSRTPAKVKKETICLNIETMELY